MLPSESKVCYVVVFSVVFCFALFRLGILSQNQAL